MTQVNAAIHIPWKAYFLSVESFLSPLLFSASLPTRRTVASLSNEKDGNMMRLIRVKTEQCHMHIHLVKAV